MEGCDPGHRNGQKEMQSTIYKIIQQKPHWPQDACGVSVPETCWTELLNRFLMFFSSGLWKQCFSMWSPPDRWSYRRKGLITSGWGHQGRPSSVCVPENNDEKPSSLARNNCPSPVSVPSGSLIEGSSGTKSMSVHLLGPVFPCTCWRNSKASWRKSWLIRFLNISLPAPPFCLSLSWLNILIYLHSYSK